jgi:hypothetical protein
MAQVPQVPPQPSLPHCLPLQSGWQHVVPVHLSPAGHAQSVGQVLQSSRDMALHA